MLVDSKSKIVSFCNIFYIPKLEYNLLLIGIIEKFGYLILVKKRKKKFFIIKKMLFLKLLGLEFVIW